MTMVRPTRLLLLSFALALALVGCYPKALPSGGLITLAGTYAPLEQTWVVAVATNGQFQVSHRATRVTERQEWQPKRGWFLFIEDARHLWTYDGDAQVNVFIWANDGSLARHSSAVYPGAIPDPVLRALPASVREKVRAPITTNSAVVGSLKPKGAPSR